MKRTLSIGLWTIVLAIVTAGATAAGAAVPRTAVPVPASGTYIGAHVDIGQAGGEQSDVSGLEAAMGRKLDIDSHYYGWTDKFPSGLEQWDLQSSRTPVISWKAGDLDSIVRAYVEDYVDA